MLYYLWTLHEYFFAFNVFQYITFRSAGAIITALFLTWLVAPRIILILKKKKIGQQIREDGPQQHFSKSGTPTMGGGIILFVLIITTILWARLDNRCIILILLVTAYLGLLGFYDDYLKLIKKCSKGLGARYKLIGQIILALSVGAYLYSYPPHTLLGAKLGVPFFKEVYIPLGILYLLLVIIVVVGSSNAVNLTDGLDGLAIGAVIFAAGTYAIFSYVAGHAKISSYLYIVPVKGAGELSVYLSAMIGAGLGFLWYNAHPAQIFMGDTGALFLGGTIGVIALLIKQELLLVIVGGIFVAEAVSVIIQVLFYKWKRKRVFKMAPLHHHFELKGWAEEKVVVRFWIICIILSLVALSTLKLR